MIKMKSNRALMASGLSLVLCLAMLIGTTFAWFSDSVSNKGNRIQAGKLAVGFTASDTLENNDLGSTGLGDLADESIKLFDLVNWAPGDTYTRYMRVKNLGSLALKYNINFVLSGDNSLADAIKLDVSPAINAPTVVNGSNVSAASAENIEMNGALAKADDFQIFKVDLSFLESAGNTYQGGSFGLDVNLVATQNNANANIITAKDASAFANVPANSTIVLQKDITTAESIAITEFVNIDLNGYTLTCKDFSIVNDDAIGTIDVANGKIVADNIKISAEKGSVNVSNLNGTVSATGTVYLNGSMNTVNILKGTQFIISGTESPAPIEIQSETRVVVSTTEAIALVVENGANKIIVEDKRTATEGSITVSVPADAVNVQVVNSSTTTDKIIVDGDGAKNVVDENNIPYGATKVTPTDDIQAVINNASENDVLFFEAGSYPADITVNKALTITGTKQSVFSGLITVDADNVTIQGISYKYIGKDTIYGNILVNKNGCVIQNCDIYAQYTHYQDGITAGTEGGGRFGVIRPTGENFTILNSTLTSNAMGLFPCAATGRIEGNTFNNLPGATSRTLALNSTSMNGLQIKNNIFNNRYILIGGNATITGNTFANRGSKTAYLFYANFTGTISGNNYGSYSNANELYFKAEGVTTIPDSIS